MTVHFTRRYLIGSKAACGADPWPTGQFSTNLATVTCWPCREAAKPGVQWSGERQAHYLVCQGCDCIVEGDYSAGEFIPFRGRVVNGEAYCQGCYVAKAAALSTLTVPTC